MQSENINLPCADIFSGQRILVVGLGETGLSCVRFFYERGVDIAVTDSRLEPPGLKIMREQFPDIAVFVGGFDEQAITSADVLILSPGVALKSEAIVSSIKGGKIVIGDVEVFSRCVDQPVVAITGSNGKSTVTTLVGEMARLARKRVFVGGNIGKPVLDLVEHNNVAQLFVLELSSFQLETTTSLNATASVILNISEDHMDRYDSLEEYARAKARIYQGDGVIVLNQDDQMSNNMVPELDPDRVILKFTLSKPADENCFGVVHAEHGTMLARGDQMLMSCDEIKIKGQHNISNALASLALGTAVGLPMTAMLEALRIFPGLPHRTQWVAEYAGVQWFNDSKATNVGAAIAAINGMPGNKLFVILGGQGKGQEFSPLHEVLSTRKSHVILLGQDADRIATALGHQIQQTRVADMNEAVKTAYRLAKSGDIVLLSPACASFDMFNGYADRGDTFMRLVKELA